MNFMIDTVLKWLLNNSKIIIISSLLVKVIDNFDFYLIAKIIILLNKNYTSFSFIDLIINFLL